MKFTEDQQQQHELVMRTICEKLRAEHKPMVLKGGTALKLCYGLDRFSEDLDFDAAVSLNLEHFIEEVFKVLGKGFAHLRGPRITTVKDTKTVKRYRVEYGDSMSLKIETSLRGTPNDDEIIEINGILTYKVNVLISQKLGALRGRTAARDLHDIIFLFDRYYQHFDDEQIGAVVDLYTSQTEVLSRYAPAFEEDPLLAGTDLLKSMMRLVELVEQRGY